MEEPHAIAHVLRVVGHDTLQMRTWCPLTQARSTLYATLCGVSCREDAKEHIIDWCEIHADAERLRLVSYDYLRDEYGRLLVDLADINSGETLSAYLISLGAAESRPKHIMDMLGVMLTSREVDDAGW